MTKKTTTVRLYERAGAHLALWHVEGRQGWSGIENTTSAARLRDDAPAIAADATGDWPVPKLTTEPKSGSGTVLVAEWIDGEVAVLQTPGPAARVYLGMRGRPPVADARTSRLEIRLSSTERAELERAAGDEDLGTWVRAAALRAAARTRD